MKTTGKERKRLKRNNWREETKKIGRKTKRKIKAREINSGGEIMKKREKYNWNKRSKD